MGDDPLNCVRYIIPFCITQKKVLIKTAKSVLYENKMRLVTGPKKTDDVLVVVLSNAVVLLREKEKDGHIAYRLLRDVRTCALAAALTPRRCLTHQARSRAITAVPDQLAGGR